MLSLIEIQRKMGKLDGWSLEGNVIVKERFFDNFKDSMVFVNKVGEIAEGKNHYPEILIASGIVQVTLTNRKEGGLTEMDFEVAEEIDKIKLE